MTTSIVRAAITGAASLLLLAAGSQVSAQETAPANEAVAAQPKGYLIAEVTVINPEPYREYLVRFGALAAQCGGSYVVRGGRSELRDGAPLNGVLVIIEFPTFDVLQTCLNSEEYRAFEHIRTENAQSRIIIIEGFAPQ